MRIETASLTNKRFDPLKSLPYNDFKFDQSRLNVEIRNRKSRLPWRGQFSPNLIEYIMEIVCSDSRAFYDPFCGSGTVLYEALSRGLPAWGMEINPAAWHLAALAGFANLPSEDKTAIYLYIKKIATIASLNNEKLGLYENDPTTFLHKVHNQDNHPFLTLALAAVVLLGMGNERTLTHSSISYGAIAILPLLRSLMEVSTAANCYLRDARQTHLDDETIDAVITSPPYINVFNYHQNYRSAAELLGWLPLEVAPSEIGANRKHRMNRFLTVIQYCLDMSACLDETSRLMRPNAPLVVVLGRTSNVLGTSIRNGFLIKELLELSDAFTPVQSAERVFTNRFGERIYEDILITYRQKKGNINLEEARLIGIAALSSAKKMKAVPPHNQETLEQAIERSQDVRPSPLLNISVPKNFICKETERAGDNVRC